MAGGRTEVGSGSQEVTTIDLNEYSGIFTEADSVTITFGGGRAISRTGGIGIAGYEISYQPGETDVDLTFTALGIAISGSLSSSSLSLGLGVGLILGKHSTNVAVTGQAKATISWETEWDVDLDGVLTGATEYSDREVEAELNLRALSTNDLYPTSHNSDYVINRHARIKVSRYARASRLHTPYLSLDGDYRANVGSSGRLRESGAICTRPDRSAIHPSTNPASNITAQAWPSGPSTTM